MNHKDFAMGGKATAGYGSDLRSRNAERRERQANTRRKVAYEWVVEESDEHGDIWNVDHADTLIEAMGRKADCETAGEAAKVEVALLRISYDDIGGEQVRHYAYLRDGKLPEVMESCDGAQDGPAVPQRFHKEAASVSC